MLESGPMRAAPERNRLTPESAPSDLAWRVLGLVNLYRLLVAAGLLVASQFDTGQQVLGIEHPREMLTICALWFAAGIGLMLLRRLPGPGLRTLALTHAAVDSVAVGFLLWAAGGVGSGLGILLLLPIGAMALLSSNRDAFFIASIATLALLVQQFAAVHGQGGADSSL